MIAEYTDISSDAIELHSTNEHSLQGIDAGAIKQVTSGHGADVAKFEAPPRVAPIEPQLLKKIGMVPTTSPALTVRDDMNKHRQLFLKQ